MSKHAKNDYFHLFMTTCMLSRRDEILDKEIKSYNHNNYYLAGAMIEKTNGHINFNFGDNYNNFDEGKLLKLYSTI